jgi:hypothetical protein
VIKLSCCFSFLVFSFKMRVVCCLVVLLGYLCLMLFPLKLLVLALCAVFVSGSEIGCKTCVAFMEDAEGELIDIILQGLELESVFDFLFLIFFFFFFFFFFFNEVGISEGCSICGRLKSKLEQEVCGVLCEIVGIETFAKVLQGSDIDPIYVSFKTHDVSFNFSLGSGLHRTVCLSSKPLLAARLVRVICVLLFRSHCKAKYVHHQRRRAASGLFRSVLAIFFYFYLFFFFFNSITERTSGHDLQRHGQRFGSKCYWNGNHNFGMEGSKEIGIVNSQLFQCPTSGETGQPIVNEGCLNE